MTYVKADNTVGICDKSVDADCDGLTDAEEKLYGTDASKTDSDDDGYSDKIEIESGYDPTKPAPGDRITALTDQPNLQAAAEAVPGTLEPSPTEALAGELESLVDSKDGTAISNEDVKELVASNIDEIKGVPITMESLPAIDDSTIKKLDQSYTTLSAEEKKTQLKLDAEKYLLQIVYLIISSSPRPLLSEQDFTAMLDELVAKLSSFSEANTDYAYFIDLSNRAEALLPQLLNMEVPETFLASHVKIVKIINGFISLRESFASAAADPVSKMVLISKIQELIPLLTDFFQIDFINYLSQLE